MVWGGRVAGRAVRAQVLGRRVSASRRCLDCNRRPADCARAARPATRPPYVTACYWRGDHLAQRRSFDSHWSRNRKPSTIQPLR